jgi:lysophospholipase L1-like esterase
MKYLLIVVVASLFVFLIYEVARILVASERSKPIIAETKKFERPQGIPQVLVIGDSTGFGTGATKAEDSVAGRLGADFPNTSVRNMSVNGLRMGGLLKMLTVISAEEHYALILLMIGGNDILRFTNTEDLERSTAGVLDEAKKHGDTVVFMSTGDIGNAPAFGPVLSYSYHLRSQSIRKVFIEESAKAKVVYVDLYEPKGTDPFVLEPWVYHSGDGLHPSSAGYGVWYKKLKAFLPL